MPGDDRRTTRWLFPQPWPQGEYRFFQIGVVVDDLPGAARRWADVFGVGPFHVLRRSEVPCRYRGEQSTLDLQVAVAQAGPVQIELIRQFDDRPSVFRERFAVGRTGIHQLCTVTEDYDGTSRHYSQAGYEPACEIVAPGHRVAYFDTFDDFGFFTEVVESSARFLADLATISATCDTWDGRDPVRILTRGGYRTP